MKSKIPLKTWDDPVSALNHTAGFAKFADLIIESIEDTAEGVAEAQDSNVETVVDIIGVGMLNCFPDFDEVTEITANVKGKLVSDEIVFDNRVLSDYFESIGNRVLYIDDVSSQFNSNARPTNFAPIISFDTNSIYNKLFSFTQDKTRTDEKQGIIISVIQQDGNGYIQQYADVDTGANLGDYEYVSTSSGFDIVFYPESYEYDIYDTSTVSFNIFDNVVGVGSTNIGDVILIDSFQTDVAAATTTTVASIGSSFRSSKFLIQIENDHNFSAAEFNIIHDGTDVYTNEFGDLYTR